MKSKFLAVALVLLAAQASFAEQAPEPPQAPPCQEESLVQCGPNGCNVARRQLTRIQVQTQAPMKKAGGCASGSCGSQANRMMAPRTNTIIVRNMNGTIEARAMGNGYMQVSMQSKMRGNRQGPMGKRCGPIRKLRGKC